MAQHRPPVRPKGTAPVSTATGNTTVRVSTAAVEGFIDEGLTGELGSLNRGASVKEIRSTLGTSDIQRIVGATGKKPPSERTIRRWVQQDRIPDAHIAEILDRHRFVTETGGVAAVAAQVGRSASSVRKWVNGRQDNFRGSAKEDAARQRLEENMIRAGVMTSTGILKTVHISFVAVAEVRVPGPTGYTYSTKAREFRFDGSKYDSSILSREDTYELAVAVANGEHARVIAILESHASTRYADFDSYDDENGFHISSISNLSMTWH